MKMSRQLELAVCLDVRSLEELWRSLIYVHDFTVHALDFNNSV